MFESLKILKQHGRQTIADVDDVTLTHRFRGRPDIDSTSCSEGCSRCFDVCPTEAISLHPVSIDLGSCVFCGACETVCPTNKIHFSNDYHLASERRDTLYAVDGKPFSYRPEYSGVRSEIEDIFGGSLKLRQVSAGGCNGCELELGACSNVNFDMARYGIEFVASPRHADGIVLTGPLTRNMLGPFLTCYEAVPDPKMVIMTGACSISGGVFANSPAVARGSIDDISIDLFVPGCPPHPLTFITGVLRFVRRHGKRR